MSNATFEHLDGLVASIQEQFEADLLRMQAIADDRFFLDHAHIAYSEIFRNIWRESTRINLIAAFANNGTIKGLIYVLRAIFGSDVMIDITNNPNEISLAISNTIEESYLAMACEISTILAINADLTLAILDLRNINITNIEALIMDFLPAGVKLVSLDIS